MGATQETVAEYAAKHGIDEDAVRDIAGLDSPEPLVIEATVDGDNPAKVTFAISGYDGPVIADVGGAGFITVELEGGKFSHVFGTAGLKRVRLDLGGAVRYLDVVAGENTEAEDDTPVQPVEPLIGAPDFSDTLMAPVETDVTPQAGEPVAETDPLAAADPVLVDTTRNAKVGEDVSNPA
jgi:hypothetical protein